MTEKDKNILDIDSLMLSIQTEVLNRRSLHKTVLPLNAESLDPIDTLRIESQIAVAEAKSRIVTRIPPVLDRFPISWSKRLQKLILAVYELLFREQRHINSAFAQALRESLEINRQLDAKIRNLEAKYDKAYPDIAGYCENTDAVSARPVSGDKGLQKCR